MYIQLLKDQSILNNYRDNHHKFLKPYFHIFSNHNHSRIKFLSRKIQHYKLNTNY